MCSNGAFIYAELFLEKQDREPFFERDAFTSMQKMQNKERADPTQPSKF